MADAEDVLLDEARRKYDLQVDRLSGFRNGTATLLAAGGIVSGLFGVKIDGGDSTFRLVMLSLALGAFVALVGFSLAVLKPLRDYDEGEKLDRWVESIQNNDEWAATFTLSLAAAI